jgi:O-antigen ligase
VPLPDNHDVHTDTLVDVFLYKGKTEAGILGSRESPWQQTSAVIRDHPWFGSGFGTSVTSVEGRQFDYAFQSTNGSIREHGNSYLAILEWVGVLGVIPFLLLMLTIGVNMVRSVARMFRSADPMSPLVPITTVLIAGLIHAAFEDWMFAPGYYMCVFFWALVFIHADLLSAAEAMAAASARPTPAPYLHGGYGVLSPGR